MKAITHRDQIHGDVAFDPLAAALLDTSSLQRLGRVYQLGYAHLVFRGGTHSRLSHVMGAAHVATKLVDLLGQNYVERAGLPTGAVLPEEFLPGKPTDSIEDRWYVLRHLVRWAALLHDVGHVPLGHTLEDEFEGIYTKHDAFSSPRIPYLWDETAPGNNSQIHSVFLREELLPTSFSKLQISGERAWQTVMLIALHKENISDTARVSFKSLVETAVAEGIPFASILKEALDKTEGRTFFPYMADIVGNTICADYLDYLRRDPTNVGLDVLRDDRVASRFFVGKDSNRYLRMALALVDKRGKPRLDTCTGVVELVRQRFRFAEVIYYHKTKVAASAMLAKVFALIGTPAEIGPGCEQIDIDKVQSYAEGIIDKGPAAALALRQRCFPSALLDTEIGDETLLLWLQMQAWRSLESATANSDTEAAQKSLRGISLLQGLVQRRLYKVCLMIDRETYGRLSPGSKEENELERRLQEHLQELRGDHQRRTDIENQMAVAADWPEASLILYIPPRKSQAKGIETGALDGGEVVTLGTHSAVKDEVLRLNEAYKRLWRIILFVHPKYQRDAIGLSRAVDSLVMSLWPALEDLTAAAPAIAKAAWFHYIPPNHRPAADRYSDLEEPSEPDWSSFDDAFHKTIVGTPSSEEHADRAYLLSRLRAKRGTPEAVKQRFGTPNSLSTHLRDLEATLTVEGREGANELDVRRAALRRIATNLLGSTNRPRQRRGPSKPPGSSGELPFDKQDK